MNTATLSSSGNPIVGAYTQTASTALTGADAGNYSFGGFTSAANYAINKLALAVTAANSRMIDECGGDHEPFVGRCCWWYAVSYTGGTATFSDQKMLAWRRR